jgi:RiboL-PSP-HEPN
MKYSAPAARKFLVSLREVGTLTSLSYRNEKKPKHREVNESISRAAILLLCSHIESFFEDAIVDILDFHQRNQTPMNILPSKLKFIQTMRKPISDSLSYERRWRILEEISKSYFVDENNRCQPGVFKAELHLKGFASPGSEAVESLFDGVGIAKIWNRVENQSGSTTLKRSLDGFVARRNNITHGASSDKPTLSDVKIYIRDMCTIVKIFDRVITNYLVDDFQVSSPWGTS